MLKAVQNSAIRLVYGRLKYDRQPISHLFTELHWLRVRERIVFKICLIVHKCVWTIAPETSKSLIVISNVYTLKLIEPRFSTVYGQRAFSRAGPKLWNCLPLNIRLMDDTSKFKKLLKSHLMLNAEAFHRLVNMR